MADCSPPAAERLSKHELFMVERLWLFRIRHLYFAGMGLVQPRIILLKKYSISMKQFTHWAFKTFSNQHMKQTRHQAIGT
jgi:hypothetical protein